MLPSMRYHSAKLAQLFHQKKSYVRHIESVDKIMHKTSDEFQRRARRLNQLKSRKMQAFNHSMNLRSKQITHQNSILFSKISPFAPYPQHEGDSFQELQAKLQLRQNQQSSPQLIQNRKYSSFILRNHRQSPIHKTTQQQRSRQNVRLAKNIIKPVITYQTKRYQRLHQYTKKMKDRIRKYEQSHSDKTKAQLYVDRKIKQTMNGNTSNANSSLLRSSFSLNPESNLI